MSETNAINIIKGAILLEHRGKALYESVVKTTKNDAVKELFTFLVKEEENHVKLLSKQFGRVANGNPMELPDFDSIDNTIPREVLTKEIVAGISGAGYESAVIAAALDFEKKAVAFYSDQAISAESEEEKKLYHWFSEWEKGHMVMLAGLDNELKEQVWYDNNFWPLD